MKSCHLLLNQVQEIYSCISNLQIDFQVFDPDTGMFLQQKAITQSKDPHLKVIHSNSKLYSSNNKGLLALLLNH